MGTSPNSCFSQGRLRLAVSGTSVEIVALKVVNCVSSRCCLEKEASEIEGEADGWMQEATGNLEEGSGFLSVKVRVLSFENGYASL